MQGFLRQRLRLSRPVRGRRAGRRAAGRAGRAGAWQIGDRLLRDRLAGAGLDARARQAEWRRGELPPGALGERGARPTSLDEVEPLVGRGRPLRAGEPRRSSTSTSTLRRRPTRRAARSRGVHGDVLVARRVLAGSAPKHRLRAWVRLLALAAGDRPGRGRRSPIGPRAARCAAALARSARSTRRAPRRVLAELVDLDDAGLREPLPLPTETVGQLRRAARHRRRDAGATRGRGAPRSGPAGAGAERTRRRPRQVLGAGRGPLDVLLDARPAAAAAASPTRFGELALRLWSPLLAAEDAGADCDARRDAAPGRPEPFDVCGPLPTGTTVLEASAGTGKTFTIAALVTRYVAEGVADCPSCMLVTFGRAATQELRERVREHLVAAERGAGRPGRGARPADDPVLPLLADAATTPRWRARRRPAARGAGRLRRGDDRHHPPVLPADARRARHRRRHRPGRGVRRGPRRPGRRGGRRPLRAQFAGAERRRRRSSAAPTRWRWPGAAVSDPQARLEPADAGPGSDGRGRRRFARRRARARWTGASGAPALLGYDDLLDPAARRAGRPGDAAGRATGCGPATGSCWSTSSRTPTRCSGRSSSALPRATRRWS